MFSSSPKPTDTPSGGFLASSVTINEMLIELSYVTVTQRSNNQFMMPFDHMLQINVVGRNEGDFWLSFHTVLFLIWSSPKNCLLNSSDPYELDISW